MGLRGHRMLATAGWELRISFITKWPGAPQRPGTVIRTQSVRLTCKTIASVLTTAQTLSTPGSADNEGQRPRCLHGRYIAPKRQGPHCTSHSNIRARAGWKLRLQDALRKACEQPESSRRTVGPHCSYPCPFPLGTLCYDTAKLGCYQPPSPHSAPS